MQEELIDSSISKPKPQEDLVGGGGILAMGILSILLCGLIGLILGIIAISKANRELAIFHQNPDRYTMSSYRLVNAGRICVIVGLSLLGLIIFVALVNAVG